MAWCAHRGFRDPFDNTSVRAVADTPEEAQRHTDLLEHLTFKYELSAREVCDMAGLAMEAIDRECEELASLRADAEQDRDLLKLALPVEEAFEIWKRTAGCFGSLPLLPLIRPSVSA